ncbi:hypothetical protein EYF80_042657 [Liparis tanakae]|uniref:Uncharacterized protein n=1 Tax=Liparis tanakae TaxID=230148 RepID=A0A4Z2G2N0_9TELE|nr:hypothetical protein EYF80_042657 [Liparis tanakae]
MASVPEHEHVLLRYLAHGATRRGGRSQQTCGGTPPPSSPVLLVSGDESRWSQPQLQQDDVVNTSGGSTYVSSFSSTHVR